MPRSEREEGEVERGAKENIIKVRRKTGGKMRGMQEQANKENWKGSNAIQFFVPFSFFVH